jgi:preprotein translocase subunit SecD
MYLLAIGISPALARETQSTLLCPFSGIEITLQVKSLQADRIQKVQTILEKRITELEIRDSAIIPRGKNQFLVQLVELQDLDRATRILTSKGEMQFRLQKSNTYQKFNSEFLKLKQLEARLKSLKKSNERNNLSQIAAIKKELQTTKREIAKLFQNSDLTGGDLLEVYAQPLTLNSVWEIFLNFNQSGEQKFARITKEIAGSGRAIGIFINDELISAPLVNVVYAKKGITGGKAVISGSFTKETAQDLVIQLRYGALPATVEILTVDRVNRDRCQ